MTPASLAAARLLLADMTPGHLSFDVFDTFLLRSCTAPDGVYERAFQLAPMPTTRRGLAESFVQHRKLAEHRARVRKWQRERKLEVRIDEIYAEFAVRVFGLAAADRPALAEAEFLAELELTLPNPDMAALHSEARAAGWRTGFLSDTYWSEPQLARLLRQGLPGLEIDFLYASASHGVGKGAGLFPIYMTGQGVAPAAAFHIGDNPVADIAAAANHGIAAVHYPQAPGALAAQFEREAVMLQLIQSQRPGLDKRLDRGLSLVRRRAAGRAADTADLHGLVGATLLGPLMLGLMRLVEDRLAALAGRRVEILFLARDGFLPFQVWNRVGSAPAHYVEINRRVALVAASERLQALQDLFANMRQVDEAGLENFLKARIPAVSAFFDERGGGRVAGTAVAEHLPELLGNEDCRSLSAAVRGRVIDYLRHAVPGFDRCTDLVLVDLGYAGTIQRTLRDMFDLAEMPLNLHGVYLGMVDDFFCDLRDGDSAVGLLDDTILTPMSKRAVLRNISLMEQFCSAPVGSVVDYAGGEVRREPDRRPPAQLRFCAGIQAACLRFVEGYAADADALGVDPFRDFTQFRAHAAAMLGGLLLLPLPAESDAFGGILQDVNLGSQTLMKLVDPIELEMMLGTLPLPAIYGAREPPMWLSASLGSVSPLAGASYAFAGFGLMNQAVSGDAKLGQIKVGVVKDGRGEEVPCSIMRTPLGETRLRVPLLRQLTGATLALPLTALGMASGALRGITLQYGAGTAETMAQRTIYRLPEASIGALRAETDGRFFRATGPDAYLLIPVPAAETPLTLVTITLERPSLDTADPLP